jgi:radical SAM protein with 4Fe4S-binding SPASM domain
MGEVGVQEVRVQNLSHDFTDTPADGAYAGIREYAAAEALWTTGADGDASETAFAGARAAADRHGVLLRLPHLDNRPGAGCTWPWDSAYVTSSGIVQPCCMVMGDGRVTLGDLAVASFPQIWHGPAYQDFRARLASDEPPEVCRGCALYQRTF